MARMARFGRQIPEAFIPSPPCNARFVLCSVPGHWDGAMKRREFIGLIGGAAVSPLTARAQQPERVRRIGVLLPGTPDDAEYQARQAAFLQALQQLGWSDGRNVLIDTRWAAGDANLIRKYAAELIALAPDVILTAGSATMGPLLQATRTVPIVFTTVLDPVA